MHHVQCHATDVAWLLMLLLLQFMLMLTLCSHQAVCTVNEQLYAFEMCVMHKPRAEGKELVRNILLRAISIQAFIARKRDTHPLDICAC